MNKTNKFFRYTLTIAFVMLLISCSNLFKPTQEKIVPEKSYIKLNLQDYARTVLPEIQNPVFIDFELKGGKTEETQITLGSWATETEMQNAEIPVTTGNWSFTLSAKKGGSTFVGTTEKEIVAGQNTLSFTLFLSDSGTGTGSFTITLSFANAQNADTVSYAIGTLENMDRTAVNGVSSQTLTPSNNTVIFSGSEIKTGTYRARIKFYTEENNDTYEIASYSELVQISSDLCSSANRTIESFEELYTVTYILNGGSFAAGTTIPETFSRKTSVTLPQGISKDYYTFVGWYTDENCTEGNTITTVSNTARDINVYAKYTPVVFTITYDLGYSSITDSYTIEDNISLREINEAEDIIIDSYWYEDEECEGSAITGWTAGEKHSDITLYADYTVNATTTASTITDKIRGMKRSGTIKGIGAFNTLDIREINQALKNLRATMPLVKVTLDLSEITGLTRLEDASYQNQNYSFYGCGNLIEITLPTCLTSIGDYAFFYCSLLEHISVSDNTTSIGACAFFHCIELKDFTIPSHLTKIEWRIFCQCESLTNIIIPEGVTSIGIGAFENCTSLGNITIPETVTAIGAGAFSLCKSLKTINIPENAEFFNECAISTGMLLCEIGVFAGCSSLQSINLPTHITSIAKDMFKNCKSLKSITIPDSVTSIQGGAFSGCSSLEEMTTPSTGFFAGIFGETPYEGGIETKLLSTVFYVPSTLRKVTVTGRKVSNYAFSGCTNITEIVIQDSVTSIGYDAFSGCSALTSITIPESVTSIGDYAFHFCTSLASITIPNRVTVIGDFAFYYCTALASITLPNSVTSIGHCAFGGCISLTSIIIPSSVTSIGSMAFSDCISLTSIIIPSSITSIEAGAFSGCSSLTSITIPSSVTSIGSGAFSGCSSLTSITIPSSVTCFVFKPFVGCDSLEHIVFQDTTSRWKLTPDSMYSNLPTIEIGPMSATNTANNVTLFNDTYVKYTWEKITE
ncbi:MAG: leucine-rich repeat protein [Spirochaetaceae bacterium]|nr:leucine-rich repeat protein [Spirochaetaceae bacterium]